MENLILESLFDFLARLRVILRDSERELANLGFYFVSPLSDSQLESVPLYCIGHAKTTMQNQAIF